MPTPAQIREKLEEMAKLHGPAVSNIATVKSVDETKATCVLVDEDGQELLDVRLRPVLNGKKAVMLLPKVGSSVLAVRVEDDDDWMVVGVDEVSKVGYYVGSVVVEFTEDGFLLKKQNETLKQLISDLITAIENMSFTVTTPDTINGSTTIMSNLAQFSSIKTRFNSFLK